MALNPSLPFINFSFDGFVPLYPPSPQTPEYVMRSTEQEINQKNLAGLIASFLRVTVGDAVWPAVHTARLATALSVSSTTAWSDRMLVVSIARLPALRLGRSLKNHPLTKKAASQAPFRCGDARESDVSAVFGRLEPTAADSSHGTVRTRVNHPCEPV